MGWCLCVNGCGASGGKVQQEDSCGKKAVSESGGSCIASQRAGEQTVFVPGGMSLL